MTYNSALEATEPDTVARVTVLRCRDDFVLDPSPLTALFATKAAEDAEASVCRALEEIATRLDRLHMARTAGHFDQIPDHARRVSVIAGGLGLIGVQATARSVADAAVTQSGVAISATTARLERCFDQAVTGIWDFRIYS